MTHTTKEGHMLGLTQPKKKKKIIFIIFITLLYCPEVFFWVKGYLQLPCSGPAKIHTSPPTQVIWEKQVHNG